MLILPGVSNYQRIMASIQTKRQDPGSSKTSTSQPSGSMQGWLFEVQFTIEILVYHTKGLCQKTSRNMPWWVGTFFVHNSWILLIDKRNPARKPVEGKVLKISLFTGMKIHPRWLLRISSIISITSNYHILNALPFVHADDLGHCKILQASHVAQAVCSFKKTQATILNIGRSAVVPTNLQNGSTP